MDIEKVKESMCRGLSKDECGTIHVFEKKNEIIFGVFGDGSVQCFSASKNDESTLKPVLEKVRGASRASVSSRSRSFR